jgi:hypothetical protein
MRKNLRGFARERCSLALTLEHFAFCPMSPSDREMPSIPMTLDRTNPFRSRCFDGSTSFSIPMFRWNAFGRLAVGSEVRFVAEISEKGAQAASVRLSGKHHLHQA